MSRDERSRVVLSDLPLFLDEAALAGDFVNVAEALYDFAAGTG